MCLLRHTLCLGYRICTVHDLRWQIAKTERPTLAHSSSRLIPAHASFHSTLHRTSSAGLKSEFTNRFIVVSKVSILFGWGPPHRLLSPAYRSPLTHFDPDQATPLPRDLH